MGFLGFVVLGILIGFAAIMAELEEPQAHVHYVISNGPMTRAEWQGISLKWIRSDVRSTR